MSKEYIEIKEVIEECKEGLRLLHSFVNGARSITQDNHSCKTVADVACLLRVQLENIADSALALEIRLSKLRDK